MGDLHKFKRLVEGDQTEQRSRKPRLNEFIKEAIRISLLGPGLRIACPSAVYWLHAVRALSTLSISTRQL